MKSYKKSEIIALAKEQYLEYAKATDAYTEGQYTLDLNVDGDTSMKHDSAWSALKFVYNYFRNDIQWDSNDTKMMILYQTLEYWYTTVKRIRNGVGTWDGKITMNNACAMLLQSYINNMKGVGYKSYVEFVQFYKVAGERIYNNYKEAYDAETAFRRTGSMYEALSRICKLSDAHKDDTEAEYVPKVDERGQIVYNEDGEIEYSDTKRAWVEDGKHFVMGYMLKTTDDNTNVIKVNVQVEHDTDDEIDAIIDELDKQLDAEKTEKTENAEPNEFVGTGEPVEPTESSAE